MKHQSKSNQRDELAATRSPAGVKSSRRRFLKQSLAAGIAGAGIPRASGQSATKRAKPHKSPSKKPDHADKLPKDLKKSMDWDFERFLSEIIDQINNGKTTTDIEKWISPPQSTAKTRQIVKTEAEGDQTPTPKNHPLGVCLVDKIEWKMDGQQIAGFIIRGRMGREEATGNPLECDQYSTMDQTAASRESGAGAVATSGRRPRAHPDHMLVVAPRGSSSSSSSSSSWPPPLS